MDCQICLDSDAIKIDTSIFNCKCTFYSHPTCFATYIYHQQLHKMVLDCPICHTGVFLEDEEHEEDIIIAPEVNRVQDFLEKGVRIVCVLFILYLYVVSMFFRV